MASKTSISNLALSHIGVGKEIANLDTEKSEEAKACRTFYKIARETTLRAFNWPFARTIVDLGLVKERPNTEWCFSYQYPSDCLKAIRILSGIRNDSRETRVPFVLAKDSTGPLIYTDSANAQLEYICNVDTPDQYPTDFELAMSFQLASLIAARLTKADPFQMRQAALAMYNSEIDKAKTNAANEEQDDTEVKSELERSRN